MAMEEERQTMIDAIRNQAAKSGRYSDTNDRTQEEAIDADMQLLGLEAAPPGDDAADAPPPDDPA